MTALAVFALVVVALAAAALFVPRLAAWYCRVTGRAGAAAVPPQHEGASARGMAVPAVQGTVIEREPYDNGCLLTGPRASEGSEGQ